LSARLGGADDEHRAGRQSAAGLRYSLE
jgi:hypothetical protein